MTPHDALETRIALLHADYLRMLREIREFIGERNEL